MLNQQFFNLQTELQTNNNYTTTLWTNQSASTGLNDIYISKQDVSVGTEPLTVKDFKRRRFDIKTRTVSLLFLNHGLFK